MVSSYFRYLSDHTVKFALKPHCCGRSFYIRWPQRQERRNANNSIRIASIRLSGKSITDFVRASGDLWEWLKHQLVRIENRSFHLKGYL